jgi:hypothetical protein
MALLLGTGVALAQSVGGTLRGRVRDASGGVIAGARLTARDTARGILFETRTDEMGVYQIALPVGTYELEATATDFASVKEAGVTLSLGQALNLDFKLPVRGIQESIEVRAQTPLVDVSSGTLAGLVDRERLADLPLNGRDFGNLALLQPGVLPNPNGANAPFGGKWAQFVINGQIDQATLFLLDGSEINDLASGRNPSGSSGLLLGLEGVQEFQVLLHNYKAEFGKNAAGVIHVATRSGTNEWHGSAFEYLRNDKLDARNFFDLDPRNPQRRSDPPPFKRNQFGFSLGGPLRRDQAFFFLNYEGLRERKTIPATAIVPEEALRSTAAPAVVPFLNLYPLPNVGRDSYVGSALQPIREDYGMVRVDHRLERGMNLFGRFSTQDSFSVPPFASTPVPGFPQELPHRNTYSSIGWTAPIGTRALSEFHFSFNRTFGAIELPPPPAGLTITPIPGRSFGLINVSGISNLGTQTFVPRAIQNLFETVENFSYRRGRHAQKYGVALQRYQDNELRGTFFNGQYTFAGVQQFLAGTPASWIGVLGGTSAEGPASPAGWRWTTLSVFAQDDVEVLPNLMLNLGVRYEFSTSPSEVHGELANLRSPLDAQITYAQLFNTIARSWAPRFGFAWNPSGGGRYSLRGGYGIFFNPLVVNMWANSRLVPPYVNTVLLAPGPPFPNPLATGRNPAPVTTGQSIDYVLSQPYAQQWTLEWQQQLDSNWVIKVGYAGNRGLHLIRSLEANPGVPTLLPDGRKCFNAAVANPSCPNGATARRNLNFGAIRGRSSDGMSSYNALQLSAQRRLGAGWALEWAYTWSKALSTSNSSFTTFPSQPSNTQDPDDPFLDKGLSAFDARHRLVFNFLYQLPSWGGPGKWRHAVNGWSVAGIGSFSAGYPFTVIEGFNRSQNLATDIALADRPDVLPGLEFDDATHGVSRGCGTIAPGTPVRTPGLWFDPCAFTLQPAGFYGNAPRNAFTGPQFANLDLSVSKTFAIREPHELEFRSDLFNLFNHPNLATPSSPTGAQVTGGVIVFPSATGNPTGGQIFRTVTDSRQIQFSLRYRF